VFGQVAGAQLRQAGDELGDEPVDTPGEVEHVAELRDLVEDREALRLPDRGAVRAGRRGGGGVGARCRCHRTYVRMLL
jgi:hypothetical protein